MYVVLYTTIVSNRNMGVDHGLGGRDGKKSKDRRLKRSKKNKVIATKALRGGSNKFIYGF